MFRRKAFYPNNMIQTLGRVRPKFKDLATVDQHKFAELIWSVGADKRKAHSVYEGAISFSYEELDRKFQRSQFKRLNEALQFFDRLDESYRTDGGKGHTAGWRLQPDITVAIDRMLDNIKAGKKMVKLVYEDGRNMLKEPKTVPAKGRDGQTIDRWKKAKTLKSPPVNMMGLRRLLKHLERTKRGKTADLFSAISEAEIDRLLDIGHKALALSSSTIAYGKMIHSYEQIDSGRLYAQGINLQNSQRLLKQVALYGLWEYDIANCHYAIFKQMAKRVEIDTPHIDHYLQNKEATRKGIADRVGITPKEAKDCLIMTLYGSPASPYHENAIPEAIGVDAAKRLFVEPTFKGLAEEIKGGRAAILSTQIVLTGRGGQQVIKNAFGRAIDIEQTAPQKLAHLVQGVEAWMMDLMVSLHSEDIVLLQHDGFASTRKLEPDMLTRMLLAKTGYLVELEEVRICVPADLGKPRH